MINITRNSVALLFAVTCSVGLAQWSNSLKPAGDTAPGVTVVTAGKAVGSIIVPAKATGPEKKAADDLQHWISEMTSQTLPIRSGKAGTGSISIKTDTALGDEGYRIEARDGQLALSGGRTRGVVNAVYALLEEDLGCRFYTTESIRLLPRSDTLTIEAVPRKYIPKLMIRDPFYFCAFDPVWSLQNRTNAPRAKVPEQYGGHVDYDNMFVHTADKLLSPAIYLKEHPEYFSLQPNGKRDPVALCATNPDVAKIAIKFVRDTIKNNPHTEIISVSKNDVQTVCHCERCKKLREAEGSDMANQLVLVNQVADAIATEYPRVTIDTLAYLETIGVPKTMRPRKNVSIRLCNDTVGAWTTPFIPAEQCPVAKLVNAWSAAHNRISIWDYNVNFSHYIAPMPNLDVMVANIRFWMKNNAESVMLQGGYQCTAERDELKCWVTAKLMWDPSLDEKALTHDFIWGHYGNAAPELEEYEGLLDRMRVEHADTMSTPAQGIRYPMNAPFLSKDFLTSASAIFARARGLAGEDAALLRRVERAELPILYVKCERGPDFVGEEYPKVVEAFERVAMREKVVYLAEESRDLERRIANYRKLIK